MASGVLNIPAPYGGLNARDAISGMPSSDAIRLVDWIPRGTYVEEAPIVTTFLYTADTRVFTLAPYEAPGSAGVLIEARESPAFSGAWALRNITGTPANLKTGQTSGIYVVTMFTNLMVLINGTDTPQVFNGTTCSDLAVTGVTMTDLRGCLTFKGRVYYWMNDELAFYYPAAGQYQGALTKFSVDMYAKRGGRVVLCTTITRDGGEGSDDLFVVVTSTGQAILYQGDNPGSASAWEMVGVFDCPLPLGVRSATRYGRTTLLQTAEGILDLSQLLQGQMYPAFSDKVINVTTGSVDTNQDNRDLSFGMEFPEASAMLFTAPYIYPISPQGLPFPICMEKTTRGWFHYNSRNMVAEAVCGCVFKGGTYLAGGIANLATIGTVWRVLSADNSGAVTNSASWQNTAKYGFAFATTREGIVYTNYTVVTTLPDVSNGDPRAVCAYTSPFDALSGQATAIQVVYDTQADVWSTTDRIRWYRTSLRVKAGGKR